MKLSDLRDLSKDDLLAAMGLTTKPSASDRLFGTLGIFSIGLLVGAGAALLLAPKSGQELRQDLGDRLRKARKDKDDDDVAASSDEPAPEADART